MKTRITLFIERWFLLYALCVILWCVWLFTGSLIHSFTDSLSTAELVRTKTAKTTKENPCKPKHKPH